MKTLKATTAVAACVSALTVTAALQAMADDSSTMTAADRNQLSLAQARNEKSYTGMIMSVDPRDHTIAVRNWPMFTRRFNLGDNCFCAQVDNNNAPATDLRPGEKVTIRYLDSHGVLIANRIEQDPMQFAGTIIAIDNDKQIVTLHRPGLDKQLSFPRDTRITLRDGKLGSWNDVKLGSYVTATYEMPANQPTVRDLAQTTLDVNGTLTAVDLNDKTVKARTGFSTKEFQIADNCVVVMNGRTDGKLSDLRLNDKLQFSYDQINGVNIVTRIGPAEAPAPSVATTPRPEGSGMGYGYGGY